MLRHLSAAAVLVLGLCGASWAQEKAPAIPSVAAPATPAPAGQAPGVQSANIFEIAPDASADPAYAKQNAGERARVQPGNSAPTWRQVGAGVTGFTSLPRSEAPEAGNLIQPSVQYPGSRYTTAGEAWRQVRNNWIIPYGGALLLIVVGALALAYWRGGTIRLKGKPTGRKLERFTPFERAAHWAKAIAFSLLVVSGLVMAFGQHVILPVIGQTLFGWLAYVLKNVHNFAGPVFAVSLIIVIITFVRDNLPAKGDLNWLLKGGGMLSGHEVKSGRFNAGEKVVFWAGVFVLGLVVVASGLVLDKLIPGLVYERQTMQIAHMVHAVSNILMMALFMGHIYLGWITEGALEGMKTGYVDETWAKEHHEGWLEDIQAGRIPAQRSAQPVVPPPVQV